MSDASGATAWTYDVEGAATTEQRTIGTVTKSISYGYNLDGSLASLTYPSGRIITYTPNAAGQPVSAVDQASSINYALSATYAPHGALSSVVYGQAAGFAGITATYSYTNRLQPNAILASSSNGTVLDMTYGFNAGTANNGNVASILTTATTRATSRSPMTS